MESQNDVYCIKCKSNNLHSDTKGFSVGKALVGGVLTGGVGLLAGLHGSKKITITCLSCGNQFLLQEFLEIKQKNRDKILEELKAKELLELRIKNKPTLETIESEIISMVKSGSINESLLTHYKERMVVDNLDARTEINKILKENNLFDVLAKNEKVSNDSCLILLIIIVVIIIVIICTNI